MQIALQYVYSDTPAAPALFNLPPNRPHIQSRQDLPRSSQEPRRPEPPAMSSSTTTPSAKVDTPPGKSQQPVRPGATWSRLHVFLLLVAFRIVNALTVRTFFQPDEYFQALEPAWKIAFGEGKEGVPSGSLDGPWITWVCLISVSIS